MVWDEETIRTLKELWGQGHSTAEIGRRLGVSKNAIVGKAHRLELDGRPSPIRRDVPKPEPDRAMLFARPEGPTLPPLASAFAHVFAGSATNIQPLRSLLLPVAPARATPRPASAVPPPAPAPRAVMPSASFQQRRSAPACCWPIGEPGTKAFRFCDETSLAGKPYCDEHARLAYVKVRDRKEDAA
jgi:GcrA cell cycle regulator